MRISYNKILVFLLILDVLMIFLVLYNINQFMPVYKTCIDEIDYINKCGCVPDGLLNTTLFG